MRGCHLSICSFLASSLLFFAFLPCNAAEKSKTDSSTPQSLDTDGYVLVMNVELPHNTLSGGFSHKLKSHFGPHLQVKEEAMNISDITDTASINGKYRELTAKYEKVKPLAIVFYGTVSMVAMSPLLDGPWKGVPIVCVSRYSKVYRSPSLFQQHDSTVYTDKSNFVPIESFLRRYNATIVYRPPYIYEDIKLIFNLLPKRNRLVLVTDGEYDRTDMTGEVERVLSEKFPSVEFKSLTARDIDTEDLFQKLSSLDSSSVLLLDSWDATRESFGDNFMQRNIYNIICGVTEVPIFILEDIGVDKQKIVGGSYLTEDQIAESVAESLGEILSGTPASSIPSKNAGTPRSILDFYQLSKFDIQRGDVPVAAEINNRPPSFYQQNRGAIWLVLSLLAVIVGILYLNLYRMRKHREQINNELNLNRRIISSLDGVVDMVSRDGQFLRRLSSAYIGFLEEGDVLSAYRYADFIKDQQLIDKILSVESTAIDSKSVQRMEFNVDSRNRHWYLSATFIPVDSNKECMLYLRDVSALAEREKSQQQYQSMIETILDNLPLTVVMKDADTGKYSVWNKNAEMQWHVKSSDVIGRSAAEIFSPSNAEKLKTYDELVLGGEHIVNDIISLDLDGRKIYGLISKILLKYAINGKSWILSSFLDITEMRENEKTIERLNAEYTLVQQALGLATWNWDVATDAMQVNMIYFPGTEHYSPEEKKKSIPMKQYIDNVLTEDRAELLENLRKMKDGAQNSNYCEYRVKSILGSKIIWLGSYSIVSDRDSSGAPTRVIGVTMDIGNRKKAENALVEAKAAAEESNRLKSYFLADISHEIRTPLNSIVGFSNIIADTDDPDERKAYAEIIRNNNSMLLRLINDILDMSKIEAGIMEFTYSDVDINQLLHEVEEGIRFKSAPAPEVVMKVDTPLDECVMSTDRNRLSQVLSNFLSNAVKFTKEGSIVLGYKMLEGGSKIRFYCTDTGCGISEENMSSIFGKFVKINPNSQGSGIGLSLCEVIVHNLKGEIGVESKLGEGSTFWADFKYKYSSKFIDVKIDETAQAAEEAAIESSPVAKKVLIAEDNDSNFRLIKSVLGKRYDILHAWNGKEAVDLFTSESPDLILMDIKMPVMDGYEATDAIRKISKDINIIAVTAYASAEDEKRIKSGGFNGFLAKPINFEMLRNTVFNALFHSKEA